MTSSRLFRFDRLICALAVALTFGAPAVPASAQTAAARAQRAAQEPQFKLDGAGALVPDVRAEAAIIYNPVTGQVIWEQNSQNARSIASITKVMTALVFLEGEPDLDEVVVVSRADVTRASTTFLRYGDRISKGNLLHLLLIASDNAAARTIARTSPLGGDGFIARMNARAMELGLEDTAYADPSGLVADNVSSAYDMARLISYVAHNEQISSIMRLPTYTASTTKRRFNIRSTNQLVRQGDVDVRGGKTGFIRKAGYCLAALLRLPQGGPEVAVVVLGARSNTGRFWETRHLFNWFASKAEELLATTADTVAAETYGAAETLVGEGDGVAAN